MYQINWDEQATVFGETFPADKLDRAKYAQFLTGFLAGQGFDETKGKDHQKSNYVLNLNSEWGSGKTYFLKRWHESLRSHHPVVYVDAWKQDYSDDPLMTVISSVIKQLREQAGKSTDDPVFKVPRKAIGLLKAALPSMAGTLSKRYLGIDPVAIMQASENEDIGTEVKDENGKTIDMGAAASKAVQYLLDEHDAKSNAIESLKDSVKQWVQAVVGIDQKNYPAFILVDELDRCRPSYAVEMLETIKHIFDIPGVVFVVGTDTDQLQHAVKAIYGEGFDARTYLGRFFNSRCTLEIPSFENLLETHCDIYKLGQEHLKATGITAYPLSPRFIDKDPDYKIITKVFESLSLTSRQAIQITNRLIAILDNLESGVTVDIIYLVFLVCLKEKHPDVYDQHCRYPSGLSSSTISEIQKSLQARTKLGSINFQLYFEPSSLCKIFPSDRFSSLRCNWINDVYDCSVYDYITAINQYLCIYKEQSESIIGQAINSAKRLQEQNNMGITHGKIWLELEYGRYHQKNGQNFEVYKKLVELSSALDSIELYEEES